jgi:hypothetical protein
MKKYLLGGAVCLVLLLAGCDLSEPSIPGWDVDLSIPLMSERYLISELADSVNIIIDEDNVLTMTAGGSAATPPFGDVNFTPEIELDSIPLFSGMDLEIKMPLHDPAETVFLSYGQFEEGTLNYAFNVDDQSDPVITITIPDITTPSGDPCVINYDGAGGWQGYNLAGSTIGSQGSDTVLDSLRANLVISSSQPPGTNLGQISFRINNQLGFDMFEGYLYDYERALEGTISTIDIDYPLDLDQAVQLIQAKVQLAVVNETGFAAEFHGEIRALNHGTGEERVVPVIDDAGDFFAVQPANPDGPVTTEFEFINRVSELLQIMPDEVQIMNSYLLINGGHDGTPGFVDEYDILSCDYQFYAPFQFILDDHVFEINEPVEVEISSDNQSTIEDILHEARLALEVVNRIPVGASARIYVSTNEDIDTSDPGSYDFSREFRLYSSEYSGDNIGPEGQQHTFLSLNNEELDIFTNPLVYLHLNFSLDSTDGPVTIHASAEDYIQIKAMLSANIEIEVEE